MCCAAIAATSAAPNVPSRKSHSETGISVGSTACMISWSKLFRAEDRGTVARKRTSCAIIVSGEKSRVQKRRYARFAMERELYRAPEQEANPQQASSKGMPRGTIAQKYRKLLGFGRGRFRKFRGNFLQPLAQRFSYVRKNVRARGAQLFFG